MNLCLNVIVIFINNLLLLRTYGLQIKNIYIFATTYFKLGLIQNCAFVK